MAYEPFVGEICMFAGNFAPQDWALCDGQMLPISGHEALYSLLGTTYGGDGRTNFGLPDLRGRSPRHVGQGPGLDRLSLGQRGGSDRNNAKAVAVAPADTTTGKALQVASAEQPIPTSDPFLGINFIIAVQGIYPSRP